MPNISYKIFLFLKVSFKSIPPSLFNSFLLSQNILLKIFFTAPLRVVVDVQLAIFLTDLLGNINILYVPWELPVITCKFVSAVGQE